jgi:hypothetical protein
MYFYLHYVSIYYFDMDTLKKGKFIQVSGIIFSAVAVLHGLRAFNEWDLVYNGWIVPLWVSWLAAAGLAYLAYSAFRLNK